MVPSKRGRRGFAAAAMILPILAVGAPYLFTSRCLTGLDWEDCYRPGALLAQETFRHYRELPRWNPYLYAGTPFLGSLQHNFYYPPNALLLFFPVDRAYGWIVTLHLLLAAWGTYRLTRFFRLNRLGCVISALSYSLSFCLAARVFAGHLTHIVVLCLAPMLIFLLLRALTRPDLFRILALAGWIALLLLGGHPQGIYHLALFAAAATVWKLVGMRSKAWIPAGAVVGTLLLGIGVAAIHLLPSIEVASLSTRIEVAPAIEGDSIAPRMLLSPLRPDSASPLWHERAIYFGIAPFLLAGCAFLRRPRGPVFFFAAVGAVMLLDSMARDLPVHALFARLPGLGSFRIPARSAWVTVLCFSTLSAFGWDALSKQTRSAVPLGIAAVLLTSGDLGALALKVEITDDPQSSILPPWYVGSVGVVSSRVLDLTDFSAAPVAHHVRLLNGHGYPLLRSTAEFYGRAWEGYPGPTLDQLGGGTRVRDRSVLERLDVEWIVSPGPPADPAWKECEWRGNRILYWNSRRMPFSDTTRWTVEDEVRECPNRIEVRSEASFPRTLVVREAWAPGWRASRNGRPIPVQVQDGALLSVELPAGDSRVVFEYSPSSWKVGRVVTFTSLGVALFLLAWRIRRRFLLRGGDVSTRYRAP